MIEPREEISHRLIDEAYAATLDPLRYDALMDAWLAYIESIPADEAEAHFKRDGMYMHFQRALAILDRMGRTQARDDSAAAIAAQMPGVGVVLDPSARVLAMNDGGRKLAAVNLVERLEHLEIQEDSVQQVKAWMTDESRSQGRFGFLFLPCRIGRDRAPSCLLVTPISLRKSTNTEASEDAFLLATVDIQLDGAVAEGLASAYNLSSAETEVALLLAEGLQPQEIADRRDARLTTVRTQVRSILNKLQARNTTDAVRTITGLAANFTTARAVSRAAPPLVGVQRLRRIDHMVLRDGRRLTWTEQGDFEGTPLLFFHNMLYGVSWTDPAVEVLAKKGLRVIAPSRPGFGASDYDHHVAKEDRVAATLDVYVQLLDYLNLDKVMLVGHVAGLIYAYNFAYSFPERTQSLLGISHFPYWDESLTKQLPMRQRVVAATTRRAPSALGFVVRAGVALVDSGREDQFIHALHKDVPADMKALRRPEVYHAVVDGIRHTVRQGGVGFMADCPLVLQDWTHLELDPRITFEIVHGADDLVVTPAHKTGFAERLPNVRVTELEDAGQYLLYSHWPEVIRQVESLLDQTDTVETRATP